MSKIAIITLRTSLKSIHTYVEKNIIEHLLKKTLTINNFFAYDIQMLDPLAHWSIFLFAYKKI